jgi:hypothetical protein
MNRGNASVVGASSAVAVLCLLAAGPGHAYNEFYTAGDTLQAHSTFHYELTRMLARAAGFDAVEADKIAVACQATDDGEFAGDTLASGTAYRVAIANTERIQLEELPQGAYWHMARRGCTDSSSAFAYPAITATCNTCEYFTTRDFCDVNLRNEPIPDLNSIDRWALRSAPAAVLKYPAPEYKLGNTEGVVGTQVPPGSLHAIGVYFHSLADSYSHEKCMDTDEFRSHKPLPSWCSGTVWHESEEFGPVGHAYTADAALALFRAARNHQCARGRQPRWTEADVQAFMSSWLGKATAGERAQQANAQYLALQSAPLKPCP